MYSMMSYFKLILITGSQNNRVYLNSFVSQTIDSLVQLVQSSRSKGSICCLVIKEYFPGILRDMGLIICGLASYFQVTKALFMMMIW